MKYRTLFALAASAVALVAVSPLSARAAAEETVVAAETTEADTAVSEPEPGTIIREDYIWRLDHPKYEFKHPMTVTCREFTDTEQIYRPYVVAWLSGRSVGVLDIKDPDAFVPVSVPQVVTLCEESPDTTVWEIIQVQ